LSGEYTPADTGAGRGLLLVDDPTVDAGSYAICGIEG